MLNRDSLVGLAGFVKTPFLHRDPEVSLHVEQDVFDVVIDSGGRNIFDSRRD